MFLAPRALHSSSLRPVLVILLTAMIVLHAWMFFSFRRQIATGYPDFTSLYTAGKCILQGDGRQLYDLDTQFTIQREFASEVKQRYNPLPYNHPPFEALLFAPLARLPYGGAYLVWALCNIFLILGFWYLLRPRLPALRAFFPGLPLLAIFAFFPVAMALLQGQDSILLLFLYGFVFSALATGRPFVAGLCLGLALFKFQLVLPFVLVLVLRRQWKAVAGFAASAFVLLWISAAVVGWKGLLQYPGFLLRLTRGGARVGIDPRDMPNLRGLISGSLHLAGLPATLLIIVLSIVLLALVARQRPVQPRGQFVLGFSLFLTLTIVTSYHLQVHDLSLLIFPILMVAELFVAGEIVERARPVLIGSIVVLFFTPLYAILQFSFREMNLMVVAVAMFAAGTTIALTSKEGSASMH
jgi:hypothetical protein